jgi:aryl-alcohol dehydrogenase-like predicted oxidoreductase
VSVVGMALRCSSGQLDVIWVSKSYLSHTVESTFNSCLVVAMDPATQVFQEGDEVLIPVVCPGQMSIVFYLPLVRQLLTMRVGSGGGDRKYRACWPFHRAHSEDVQHCI